MGVTLHALTMAQFAESTAKSPRGRYIGKTTGWWTCRRATWDSENACPERCTRPRPYEIAPTLFVCRQCYELEES
mgnify:CR=1 FL=1